VHRLGYLILYVSDLPVSVAFYRDVVGLAHKFTDAGYAEFATGHTRFALYEQRRAAWLTGQQPTPGPAGQVVFVSDDVDSQARRLTRLGIDILSGPTDRPWGHRTVHIADPDGFVIEFAEPIPRTRSRKGYQE
jgi:lactoylglutathione lyase